jgi:hypothetical protein
MPVAVSRSLGFMMAVHEQGKGVAGIYTREIAETKAFDIMNYARESQMPLLVVAEPDEDDGHLRIPEDIPTGRHVWPPPVASAHVRLQPRDP